MTEQETSSWSRRSTPHSGAGDVPAILEQLTDDVVGDDPGPPEVPHAGRYGGPEEVGSFFGAWPEHSTSRSSPRANYSPRPVAS